MTSRIEHGTRVEVTLPGHIYTGSEPELKG